MVHAWLQRQQKTLPASWLVSKTPHDHVNRFKLTRDLGEKRNTSPQMEYDNHNSSCALMKPQVAFTSNPICWRWDWERGIKPLPTLERGQNGWAGTGGVTNSMARSTAPRENTQVLETQWVREWVCVGIVKKKKKKAAWPFILAEFMTCWSHCRAVVRLNRFKYKTAPQR